MLHPWVNEVGPGEDKESVHIGKIYQCSSHFGGHPEKCACVILTAIVNKIVVTHLGLN